MWITRDGAGHRPVRLRRALTATAVLTLAAVFGIAGPAAAANSYGQEFRNRTSGKCFDLTNLDPANNTYIQQWDCLGNRNQGWNDGNGVARHWVFRNAGTDKCVDAYRGNNADLVQWTCDGSTDQMWVTHHPYDNNNDILQFRSVRWEGHCAQVRGGSTSNGAHVILAPCNDNLRSQQWT